MSTMSATVHGFGVSDAYIVKYGRKYLCAMWLAFTLHDSFCLSRCSISTRCTILVGPMCHLAWGSCEPYW